LCKCGNPVGGIVETGDVTVFFAACGVELFASHNGDFFHGFKAIGQEAGAEYVEFGCALFRQLIKQGLRAGLDPLGFAKLALEMFIYRLAKYIGSMTVAAGGLDALVFTGGIGENSDIIRERVLGYLGFLGLKADHEANLKARFGNAGVITTADSAAVAVVIPTNEELMIAHDTARLSGL